MKQLNINVPKEVRSAAILMLFIDELSSFIKKIIKAPNTGKKIVTEIKGKSIMLVINKPS